MSTMLDRTPSIARLRAGISGAVIAADDAGYEEARRAHMPQYDRLPAAVVRPVDAGEVAQVVSLAREDGLELAVRGGGHSVAGHSTSEGGVVLDLSALNGIELDLAERSVWAQTGLTAGEVTRAVGEHGLAVGFGDTASVGIGGLTLGGGIGYLVRRHGLTIDQLLAAEVVTADGRLLHVDGEHEPDLFWALRGGGGNFGVVTRFRYRLQPLDVVTGGMLVLPATRETIAGLVAEAEAAPDDLSLIANVMPAPPLPFVPADQVGRLVVVVLLVHAGPLDAAGQALAPLRELAPAVADLVRPLPYPELFPPEEPGGPTLAALQTLFVDGFDETAAVELLERLRSAPGPMPLAQLRVLGGAAARVPVEATAYAHRRRRIMLSFGVLTQAFDDTAAQEAWSAAAADAFRDGDAAAYVNFLAEADGDDVRAAYPGATWERLREVKRRYDPGNLFRSNHNIRPDGGRA